MVVERSSFSRSTRSRKRDFAIRSRPIVGSSRNRISGSCSTLAASSQRIRSPSDSVRTGRSSRSAASSSVGQHRRSAPPSRRGTGGRCGRAARASRAATAGTTAASAGRTGCRCASPAGAARFHGTRPSTCAVAAGGVQDAGQHLDRGRLARAVRADIREPLAGLDGERDALDGLDVAEPLRQRLRLDDRHAAPYRNAECPPMGSGRRRRDPLPARRHRPRPAVPAPARPIACRVAACSLPTCAATAGRRGRRRGRPSSTSST